MFQYRPLPPILPPIPFPDAAGNFIGADNNFDVFWGLQPSDLSQPNPVTLPDPHSYMGADCLTSNNADVAYTSEIAQPVTQSIEHFEEIVAQTTEPFEETVTQTTDHFEEIDLTADFVALRDDISQEEHDSKLADETPEVQLVMTDEWKEYFRNSAALRKHQKQREASERRRKESGFYDRRNTNAASAHSGRGRSAKKKRRRKKKKRQSSATSATKERELQKRNEYQNELEFSSLSNTYRPTTLTAQFRLERKHKLSQMYGAAAEDVRCAETFLNERFDRACDDTQPVMWPEMPIKLTR